MPIQADATIRALQALDADIRATARQALGQAAAFAHAQARATSAFKDRTGKLRGSLMRGERSPWHLFVCAGGSGARHALWVENGTKPHEIRARNGGVLRFVQGGSVRFARRVYHPGTQPTHFMLNARDAAESRLGQFVSDGVSRLI